MNGFQIIEQKLLFTMFKVALLQNYTRPEAQNQTCPSFYACPGYQQL